MKKRSRPLSIQNRSISRVFATGGAQPIATTSLRNCRTDKEFILAEASGGPLSREFALLWRGRWLYGQRADGGPPDFTLARSSRLSESYDKRILCFHLSSRETDLDIRLTYELYGDHPLVRKWLAATNRGRAPGRLEAVAWEDLALWAGDPRELQIFAGLDGTAFGSSWSGLWGEGIAMALDPGSQQGYVVLNEAPGPTAALQINPNDEPRLRVLFSEAFGGVKLEPGETFTTPAASLLLFDNSDPEQAAQTRLHDYFRQVMRPRPPGAPPVVYSTPAGSDSGSAWVEEKVRSANSAGLAILSIEGSGMLRPNGLRGEEAEAPPGLAKVAGLLEVFHMDLGIGVPLAALDPESEIAKQRPDWLSRNSAGSCVVTSEAGGEKRVMACLATDYRDHLLRVLGRLCQSAPVTFLQFTGPAACMVPDSPIPCHDPSHGRHDANNAALAIGESLRSLCEDLIARFPPLVVGFDHNLWQTNNAVDPAFLQAGHFFRICTIPDVRGAHAPMEARGIFYRRTRLFPPECLAAGLLAVDGPNPVAAVATALAGFPILAGRIERLTAGQIDWLRSILAWRDALAREVNYYERFHLLHGSASVCAGQWDGYANLSREGEGFLAVFRNGSPNETCVFPIPGVDAAAGYRLVSVLRDRPFGRISGRDLLKGFVFEAPHEDGADVIEIRRA